MSTDPETGTGTLTLKLPGADFEQIQASIDRVANSIPKDPETGSFAPLPVRRAQATKLLILAGPNGCIHPEQTDLNIHIDAKLLATLLRQDNPDAEPTAGTTNNQPASPPPVWPTPRYGTTRGHHLPLDMLKSLLCNGRIRAVGINPDGTPADITVTDTIPRRIQEHVRARDQHCRFPGCDNHNFVTIHHIRERYFHGNHTPQNLITLCTHHHTFIHRAEWTIHGNPETANVSFKRPDGTTFPGS